MRGLRSTLALLVVLVGLGAYIYFVTSKQDGTAAASDEKKVFQSASSPTSIEELKIKSEAGDVTTVQKEGDGWQIVAPITAPRRRVRGHRGSPPRSANLEIVRVIDENPADLRRVRPRRRRASRSSSRRPTTSRPASCSLGDKTPTGGNLYAKTQRREARVPHRRIPGTPRSTSRRSTCATRRS